MAACTTVNETRRAGVNTMVAKKTRKPQKAAKKKAASKGAAKRVAAKPAARKAAAKKTTAKKAAAKAKPGKTTAKKTGAKRGAKAPKLLSGGNPQIPKGYGDAPVQAYIAAMPGWKRDLGRRLDALIERTVPGVHKAVKWNSPFYGVEDDQWFLSFHCFTKYVKVAFFRGTSLRPVPPGKSKHEEVRYIDIHEDDELDEVQFADWVAQASRLPGERM
jgi:hypothetical protein